MNWGGLLPQIVALIGALGGVAGIGTAFRHGIEKRKARAEAVRGEADAGKVVTDTAVGLLEPLREQIGYLAEQLKESQQESVKLRGEVHMLRDYVAQLVDALAAVPAPVPALPAELRPGGAVRRRRPPRGPET